MNVEDVVTSEVKIIMTMLKNNELRDITIKKNQ